MHPLTDFDKELVKFLFPDATDITPGTSDEIVLSWNGYVINIRKATILHGLPGIGHYLTRNKCGLSIAINNHIYIAINGDKIEVRARALHIETLDLKDPNSLEYIKKLVNKLLES